MTASMRRNNSSTPVLRNSSSNDSSGLLLSLSTTFSAGKLSAYITAAAKRSTSVSTLLGKMRKQLRQQLILAARIIQRRLQIFFSIYRFFLRHTHKNSRSSLPGNIGFSRRKGLIVHRINGNSSFCAKNTVDVFVTDLCIGTPVALLRHIVVGQQDIFCIDVLNQVLKRLRGLWVQ